MLVIRVVIEAVFDAPEMERDMALQNAISSAVRMRPVNAGCSMPGRWSMLTALPLGVEEDPAPDASGTDVDGYRSPKDR